MLEPTAIHSYEPPAYRTQPPSPSLEGNPPSLPFRCVILECADAVGGPPPSLLHSLREQGTKLILAQIDELHSHVSTGTSPPETPRRKYSHSTALNPVWFDAVFDKVCSLTGEEGNGKSPVERYLSDNGIASEEALCFASTLKGAKALAAVEAGFIISAHFDHVWYADPKNGSRGPGVDLAVRECPTARQLAWLHTVFTQKLWCACLWLTPPAGEFKTVYGSIPNAPERAALAAVRSPMMGALGHPSWVWAEKDEATPPACTVKLSNKEVLASPDWTPMEPRIRYDTNRHVMELKDFPQVEMYCHSLDTGVGEMNVTTEVVDRDGCRLRIANKRLVSFARANHGATELSVSVLEPGKRHGMPNICIRSSLRMDRVPVGWELAHKHPEMDLETAMLSGTFVEKNGRRSVTVRCFHRIVRDDGRGDVQICLDSPLGREILSRPTRTWGHVRSGTAAPALDFIISNPRKGSWYTIEKIVILSIHGETIPRPVRSKSFDRRNQLTETATETQEEDDGMSAPFAEIEEEHRSALRSEWDRADIEVVGYRKATRFQRIIRLFRFHQVSQGYSVCSEKADKVPELVKRHFEAVHRELCGDYAQIGSDRPNTVILNRLTQPDPRFPIVRFEPRLPPACERLQFNCALGGRWHRFTLTPGAVQILVQGPTQGENQFLADLKVAPRFLIPSVEDLDEGAHKSGGVEICTLPWQEVQVQHSLTELGRPDGSAGGFYSIMRRTRFTRVEVLRRLLNEWAPGEEESAYNDTMLVAPLSGALARLKSAPRPAGFKKSDSEDLHSLQADATTRVRVVLFYEKRELARDILFLQGCFSREEGALSGEDLTEPEMLTVEEARRRCYSIPGCKGFTFQNPSLHCTITDAGPLNVDGTPAQVRIYFKGGPGSEEIVSSGWTSWRFTDGETALVNEFKREHEEMFNCKKHGVPLPLPPVATVASSPGELSRTTSENGDEVHFEEFEEPDLPADMYLKTSKVPSWEAFAEAVDQVLTAVAEHGESKGPAGREYKERCMRQGREDSTRPFRNLITDRDGTVNNYCDRYSSSIQSAYNAAWLSHFARHCTENALFVTAAPLGGRPSAEGLMELSVAPRGEFTYTGSKGREYFDLNTQRVLEAADLPQEQRELMDELHRRILALCAQPGNMKFLGIGSGLQRKFGEVTMARNDPAGTVPDPESRRFMTAVRQIKEELDPDGTLLDLHDTGTDMEMFPRSNARGGGSFDKGCGIAGLENKLQLGIPLGPNIVCGDTNSDVPMVVSSLKLMCGEEIVKVWEERLKREERPAQSPTPTLDDLNRVSSTTFSTLLDETTPAFAEGTQLATFQLMEATDEAGEEEEQRRNREEAERKAKEEEEEAREAAAGLAVLFVVSPKEQAKSKLADTVRRWCDISGARCVIVPSPDVLVSCLRAYANKVSGRSVLDPVTAAVHIATYMTCDSDGGARTGGAAATEIASGPLATHLEGDREDDDDSEELSPHGVQLAENTELNKALGEKSNATNKEEKRDPILEPQGQVPSQRV